MRIIHFKAISNRTSVNDQRAMVNKRVSDAERARRRSGEKTVRAPDREPITIELRQLAHFHKVLQTLAFKDVRFRIINRV